MKENRVVTFVWLTDSDNARLHSAQERLDKSIVGLGLTPVRFLAGRRLVLLGDVIDRARRETSARALVWCNSDVELTRDPFDVPDPDRVYGFRRREVPSGRFVHGIDMYYIPLRIWDDYLSKDIPKLHIGASYVDWWISRAMEKAGNYENLTGYIDHRSHAKSSAATQDADPYYQANFRAYNAWALRNGLDPIPAPPYLVRGVGHVWGLRHFLRKVTTRFLSRLNHARPS